MLVEIKDEYGLKRIDAPKDESGFYEAVAKEVCVLPYPNRIVVVIPEYNKQIIYETFERGGSCNIQEVDNNIIFKKRGRYEKKYLTYADVISAERKALINQGKKVVTGLGSYKCYLLEEEGDVIKASWGAMGGVGISGANRSCNYSRSMYWIKYYEKINKGYVDNSVAYAEDEPHEPKKVEESKVKRQSINDMAVKLYRLLSFSTKTMLTRTIRSLHVTSGMVEASKKYLAQLYECTEDLELFNKILLQLCMVCPRKTYAMDNLIAHSHSEMGKVIAREEDLVAALEGILLKNSSTSIDSPDSNSECDPFISLGIEVSSVNPTEQKQVIGMLPGELSSKIVNIYKVNSKKHNSNFKEYCKKNNITDTRFLWHGSRNENWLSIIQNGLLLKPNAKITGKMFGNGIYFAPKAMKSWGYTSYKNSYWAKGSSDFACMGIYETAYGKPYHPSRLESWDFTEGKLKKKGANCVHAEGGTCGLMNDEIIFYNEDAMCLRYVVEFR